MGEVGLLPVVAVSNEVDKEKAIRLLQKCEVACLISISVKIKDCKQTDNLAKQIS
jgi:hypothetical protein